MPLTNRRRNPIDSTVAAVTITDEQHTVAEFDELPGVYGFILEERPVAGTVSVRQDNTAETPFTIVLTSPLAGQVFVDFNENRGYCIFNSADNGKAIIVTYDGAGANNTVENIRAIADEEIVTQVANQKGQASGYAALDSLRRLQLPNTAGTQTSLLTNANASARTYTLPDKSGTVALLDDISAPDLGPIIDDATVASSISDTDKFAAARDASENLISVAWSLIKSSIFGAINGLTSKSTPVGADVIAIGDSTASFAGKKVTLAEAGIVKTYITAQASASRVTGVAPDAIGEYRSYLRNANARTYTETNGSPSTAPSSSNGYRLYTSAGFGTADSNNEPSRYEIFIGLNKEPVFEFYANTGRTGYISAYPFQRYGGYDVNGGFDVSYDPTTGIVQVFNPQYAGGNNFTGLTSAGDTVTADIYFDIKC